MFLLKILLLVVLLFVLVAFILIKVGTTAIKKENTKNAHLQDLYNHATEICTIKLISVGPEKIKTIAALKEYTNWDLSTAKNKIELPLPTAIIYNMPVTLAEKLKNRLDNLGTVIEIHKR